MENEVVEVDTDNELEGDESYNGIIIGVAATAIAATAAAALANKDKIKQTFETFRKTRKEKKVAYHLRKLAELAPEDKTEE